MDLNKPPTHTYYNTAKQAKNYFVLKNVFFYFLFFIFYFLSFLYVNDMQESRLDYLKELQK
jgi:magnesium-transporting ATPase (P-type)